MDSLSQPFASVWLPINESSNSKQRSGCSRSCQSLTAARDAYGCTTEAVNGVVAEGSAGLETPVEFEPAKAGNRPEEAPNQTKYFCEHVDTSNVADAALRAASLLARAAQHIEMFQAEKQRFQLATQQYQRHVGPPCTFQDSMTSPLTTTSSAERLPESPYLSGTRSINADSAQSSMRAAACHSIGALAGEAVNPKWRREESIGLSMSALGMAKEEGSRLRFSDSDTSVRSSMGRAGRGTRLCVRFNLKDPSNEKLQQHPFNHRDRFARRLQQLQRRHLRELQREQREEIKADQAHEQDRGRNISDPLLGNSGRMFTRHGLRRKAAALFKDAVRRGNIVGSPAEELRAQIGSMLYEAPNKKALEEAELRECTFRPKINKKVTAGRLGKVPWWERLHAEARKILENEDGNQTHTAHVFMAKQVNGPAEQHWKFQKENVHGSEKGSVITSRYQAGEESHTMKGRRRGDASADSGMMHARPSPSLSMRFSPSGRSRHLPRPTGLKGDHRQPARCVDSPLNGRTLLQQYLGTEAPSWLGSACREPTLN